MKRWKDGAKFPKPARKMFGQKVSQVFHCFKTWMAAVVSLKAQEKREAMFDKTNMMTGMHL